MVYRFWVNIFLFILMIFIVTIYSFNYFVDPFGEREVLVRNIYKPIINERSKKYNDIFMKKDIENYDSLILGSSRTMQMIPAHIKNANFYNFSVHVANNKEKLFLLEEWLKNKKIKKIYLGIDFYNFHNKKGQTHLNTEKFKEKYEYDYLSIETLKLSFKAFKYSIANIPQTFFEKDGELKYFEYEKQISENNFDFSDEKFLNEAKANYFNNYTNDKFEIDYSIFDILRKIENICELNSIELYVFITPTHISDIELVEKDNELSERFNIIRKKLVDIFRKVYDFSSDKVYNGINKNFYDVAHYRPILGDKIIDSLENDCRDYCILLKKD